MSDIKNFIKEHVQKEHRRRILENELAKVNKELESLNEEEQKETPSYQKATDAEFEKNLQNVVNTLGNAGKQIENMLSKLKAHKEHGMVNDAHLVGRHDKARQMLMDMYKEIRSAEIKARDASNSKY